MGSLPSGAGALVGKRLGQYELLALLALGGTAEIYLARVGGTAGFEKYVVVKCLHDHLAYDREFVQMFLDEARLGAQLDHSNIVQTLGLGEQDGRYYLVMEFVAGMSLALMARRAVERVPRGYIPVPLVLGIAVQACEGLHYAHEKQSGGKPLNLIHRDVSPQNLVVTFEGVVKVVDFGIAKAEERETATRSGTIKGKFAYMSPEQCQAKDIDRRTDVFALGVVLHELLTGRRLFKRGSAYDTYQAILECKVPAPSAQNHELDPALDPILMKALAKNPSQRYPSVEAFGEALTNYLHTRGKSAGAGDISTFIEQYYGPEINDHGARMRELLAGRTTEATGWGDEDDGSGSASVSSVDEVSQFEIIGDADAIDEGAGDADDGGGSDDEIPSESTRIEMNPMAKLEELNERVRRDSEKRPAAAPPKSTPAPFPAAEPPPPPPPPAPAPAKPAPAPLFGAATPGGSMFGGPPGGLKAAPLPAKPEPEKKEITTRLGGPSKLAPRPTITPGSVPPAAAAAKPAMPSLPSIPNRSKSPTEPAPLPGAQGPLAPPAPQPPKSFGPSAAAIVPTVINEPEPTPSSVRRGFASAPEAKTMAMVDGGFVEGAIAEIRKAEERARAASVPPPAGDSDGPTTLEQPRVPIPPSVPPSAAPPVEDIGRSATLPSMGVVSPLVSPHGASDAPTNRAGRPALEPLGVPYDAPPPPGGQPFPSGELLVPPHGTPGPMPQHPDMSLPVHLIGMPSPPPGHYPPQQGWGQQGDWTSGVPYRKKLPPWVLPVAFMLAIALATGITIAIAQALG
jgi:serine/threonine-protein kinase